MITELKQDIARHFDREGIWRLEGDDYYCYRREEEEFDRLLKGCRWGRLLEIGAGRGRFAIRYAPDFDKVVAVDISPRMLERLKGQIDRNKLNNIAVFESDAEELDLEDDSFDVVLAPQVIGHCPHPVRMLSEMSRVLKSGGKGIISTANYLSLPGLRQFNSIINCFFKNGSFFENISDYRREGRKFWLRQEKFVRDSIFGLRRFLRQAGLEIEEISGSGIFPSRLSRRLKVLEDKSYIFPVKYFCRTIIVSFVKR